MTRDNKSKQNTEENCWLSYYGSLLRKGSTWIKLKEQLGLVQAEKLKEGIEDKAISKASEGGMDRLCLGKGNTAHQGQTPDP